MLVYITGLVTSISRQMPRMYLASLLRSNFANSGIVQSITDGFTEMLRGATGAQPAQSQGPRRPRLPLLRSRHHSTPPGKHSFQSWGTAVYPDTRRRDSRHLRRYRTLWRERRRRRTWPDETGRSSRRRGQARASGSPLGKCGTLRLSGKSQLV